ncbi:MAG: hypothetical protein WBD80_23120, partial [Xanthobacteraceae bacterium]
MITAVAAHVVHDEGSSITPVTVPGTSPSVFVKEKSKSNVVALATPDASMAVTAVIPKPTNFHFMTAPSTKQTTLAGSSASFSTAIVIYPADQSTDLKVYTATPR